MTTDAPALVERLRDQINIEFSPPPPGSSLAEREMTLLMYFRCTLEEVLLAETAARKAAEDTLREARARLLLFQYDVAFIDAALTKPTPAEEDKP